MPAVPKKKPSRTRHNQKHSDWMAKKIKQAVTPVACSQCGKPKPSHTVCPECGYYKGELVVEPKTKVRQVTEST